MDTSLVAEAAGRRHRLSCFEHGQNGCDWSASRLVDYVHDYRKGVDKRREQDVARCESFTTHVNGKFTLKQKLADLMRSKNFDWDGYRKTVKGFEQGLEVADAEELKQQLDLVEAATEMQVYDEDGKTPALGKVTDTDGSFGGDMFGASYGAGGGYRFGSLSTNAQGNYVGDDKGNADNFTYWSGDYAFASVMILGTTNEVFNARMDIALTDGHLLDLQAAKGSPDRPYLTGQQSGGRNYLGESNGIQDTFNKAYNDAKPADKNRLVQGHLHFRVVGDDLFSPVNHVVTPTVYASNEPVYSFEPAEFDTTIFDDSTTVVIVFVPVTIRGWATFQAGITYSINASLDRPNVDSAPRIPLGQKTHRTASRSSSSTGSSRTPKIDGNVLGRRRHPGKLEVGLKGSLELIRLGLPYQTSANVAFFDGGPGSATQSSGTRFHADQSLDLDLSTLSGQVDGFVQVLFLGGGRGDLRLERDHEHHAHLRSERGRRERTPGFGRRSAC